MSKRIVRPILIVLGLGLIVSQFFAGMRTNPPVESDFPAPPEIHAILKESCYDCHSHETNWPWYSRVAPISWLVIHDVDEGREEMNLSRWNSYSEEDKAEYLEEMWEEIEEGEMPMWQYLITHPDANLSDSDKNLLKDFLLSGDSEAP